MVIQLAFSRYSTAIYCLVHGQMISNNETVYHQMQKSSTSSEPLILFAPGLIHLYCFLLFFSRPILLYLKRGAWRLTKCLERATTMTEMLTVVVRD